MKVVGYILQYFDEDQPLPRREGKLLYKTFQSIQEAASEMARSFMVDREERVEGPFEFDNPTQADIDVRKSVIFFRSRDITIWIETVYEN